MLNCSYQHSTVFTDVIIHAFEQIFISFLRSDSLGSPDWSSTVAVAENRQCPHWLVGWGISVASVSPEDCVEVKQLSVAEGHEAEANLREVRLTGSYYAVHCP